MQYVFFTIPILGDPAARDALNDCLKSRHVIDIDKRFVDAGKDSHWVFAVSYEAIRQAGQSRKAKIDYRELLPEAEFQVYASLRALRKSVAEAEGVPVYGVFTNQQLATMVQERVTSKAALSQIAGVGQSRVEKYAESFLKVLGEMIPKLVGATDGVEPKQ